MEKQNKREIVVVTVCLFAGAMAAASVHLGDRYRWSHFNRYEGYFGADFMGSFLYAIGDPYAIHIVAGLWFLYVAGFLYFLLWFIRRIHGARQSKK